MNQVTALVLRVHDLSKSTLLGHLSTTIMHPVGKKTIPEICKAHTLTYCPTMDLIALATGNRNLHAFRLNGQRVFGASYEDSDFDITSLRWKPNGAALWTLRNEMDMLIIR